MCYIAPMAKRASLLIAILALGATACGTTLVPLHYQAVNAPARSGPDTPLVSVGTFQDARDADYGTDWLGAIRGGYGNRLKTLRTEKPMQEVVQDAFADGLRARGIFAEPGEGKFALEGTIEKLDCSEYFNLEAHAHVSVRVTEAATHALLYTSTFRADQTEGGMGAGIFGSVETLRVLAERTLRELVDKALDDPALRKALQSP